jgi:hypothetical protein
MHFTKTIAAAFALTATVSAFPLQNRQDDAVIGDPNSVFFLSIALPLPTTIPPSHRHLPLQSHSIRTTTNKSKKSNWHNSDPLDDLLTNIQGGLRGGLDFLSIPSGSGAEKAKRENDIPGATSKYLALSVFKPNSVQERTFTDVGFDIDPLVDLEKNVEGGLEGFFDFLGASSDE